MAKKPPAKGKQQKSGGAAKGGGQQALKPSVAAHPRAGAHVRRAKGWGGLLGFGIAAYLSLRAGVPPEIAGLRALIAGACGYMLGWACAVMVWRHLGAAELQTLAEYRRRRAEELAAREAAKAAAKDEAGILP